MQTIAPSEVALEHSPSIDLQLQVNWVCCLQRGSQIWPCFSQIRSIIIQRMEHRERELLEIVRTIFQYAGSRRMTNVHELTESKIYIEILKLLFEVERLKTLKKSLSLPDNKCLDNIIEFLNREYGIKLKITGDDITSGDYNKIRAFLLALEEIAKKEIRGYDSSNNGSLSSSQQGDFDIQAQTLKEVEKVQNMYRALAKNDNRTKRTEDMESKKMKYQAYLKDVTSDVNRQSIQNMKRENMKRKEGKRPKSQRDFKVQIDGFNQEEKSSKLRLRDAKYRYINKVAKIVGELQRARINDQKRIQKEEEKRFRSKTHIVVESLENEHNNNMDMLKQSQEEIKKNAAIFIKARQELGRTLERKIKAEFKAEKEKIRNKNRSQYEQMIFELETDGIEDMLINLYKKL